MAAFKAKLKQYYRLTKPGIVYGNSLTAAGGFLFAEHGHIRPTLLVATLAGEAALMAAGCVYNNLLDQGIDAKMQRTRNRALVRGEIGRYQALVFATSLMVIGTVILLWGTNRLTAGVGLSALFAYVVLYGIGKRKTAWGTLIGSISGALPPVGGYTAATDHLDKNTLLIFLILVAWQMAHFYAIALYRQTDYKKAGLPVWPLSKGVPSTVRQIYLFIGLFLVACSGLSIFGSAGYIFLIVMLPLSIWWLRRAIYNLKAVDKVQGARKLFTDSLWVILILSIMLAVGSMLV